ncbi:unnamed protein product, partial [Lampetra fluviatilis]
LSQLPKPSAGRAHQPPHELSSDSGTNRTEEEGDRRGPRRFAEKSQPRRGFDEGQGESKKKKKRAYDDAGSRENEERTSRRTSAVRASSERRNSKQREQLRRRLRNPPPAHPPPPPPHFERRSTGGFDRRPWLLQRRARGGERRGAERDDMQRWRGSRGCRSDIATCKATRKSCRRWDSHHRGDTRCGHGDRHPRCVPSPPPSSFLFCSGPACAGHAGRRWVVEREGEEVARRSRRSQNANATAATARRFCCR